MIEPTLEMMMAYSALKTQTFRDESNTPTVVNNSGGPAYELDDWGRLRRFLVLGTEGGSYYVGQNDMTEQSARVVIKLAQTYAIRVVDEIVKVSTDGLAPKNDQALFALAIVASRAYGEAGRQYALKALPAVARTATHLFQFIEFAEQFRGWGRGLKRAVANWYLSKSPEKLAYQLVKYRQRNGWTHRDVLRLAKPVPMSAEHNELFGFAAGKELRGERPLRIIEGFRAAQAGQDAVSVLKEYGDLPWEAFPTERHNEPGFWQALIKADSIPYIATMRNLSRWSRLGVLDAPTRKLVLAKLTDPEEVRRSRVHPINVLNAQRTYASGRSERGTSTWTPIRAITDALDEAFYLSFKNVEPTGQRVLLALDVSGSMSFETIAGMSLTPREGSAAMALATLASEKDADVVGFTGNGYWGSHTALTPLDLSPRRRLDDNIRAISDLRFGGTDIALPFNWAADNRRPYDLVVVYTDNETNHGRENPANALRRYRRKMNLNTKLVVVGMTASPFTVGDPGDRGTLNVAGFDSSAPQVISNFARGLI